jgi:perosamine synthetase
VWALNHLQKPYKDCQSYKIERAEALVNSSLCLPSSTSLGEGEIQKVIDILNG